MRRLIHRFLILSAFILASCTLPPTTGFTDSDESLGDSFFGSQYQPPAPPRPVIPEGVTATDDNSLNQFSNRISVNWTPQQGVYFCRVFWFDNKSDAEKELTASQGNYYDREILSGSNFSDPPVSWIAGSYVHEGLYSGQSWYYIVKNYNDQGLMIGASEVVTGTTSKLPYNTDATRDSRDGLITVSWEWNPGWENSGFKIYKSDSPKGEYQEITPVSPITSSAGIYSYPDSIPAELQGKYFYYKITALVNEKESMKSDYALGKTVLAGAPDAPQISTITRGSRRAAIDLSWNDLGAGISHYNVYAKYGVEWLGPFKVTGATTYTFYPESHMNPDPANSAYDRHRLPISQAFRNVVFNVAAVNEFGEGVASATNSGSVLPRVSAVEAGWLTHNDHIAISWNYDSAVVNQVTFNIYRSETKDFVTAFNAGAIATSLTTRSWNDTTAVAGIAYNYWITATHTGSEEESYQSDMREGVRGLLSVPEFTVSQGDDYLITLNPQNSMSYYGLIVEYSTPLYSPTYKIKPAKSGSQSGSSTLPANYEDTLNYICNPGRHYSEFKRIATLDTVPGSLTIGQNHTLFRDSQNNIENLFTLAGRSADIDAALPPGEVKFRLRYHFKGALESDASAIHTGYRKITDREFLNETVQAIAKSQSRMKHIHNPPFTGSTGPDNDEWIEDSTPAGNVHHEKGWIFYDFNLGGIIIYIHYYDYLDYYLTIHDASDGKYNCQVSDVDSSSNGELVGANRFTGLYTGVVKYNLNIVNANKSYPSDPGHSRSASTYIVSQEGGTETIAAWDFDREPVEAWLVKLKQ